MNNWIIEPFNPLFCLLIAISIGILTIASLILRNKSREVRERVLIIFSLVAIVGFFVYKAFLSKDKEYEEIYGFNWWGELPFQLCNINMILIPISVYFRRRSLMSFCFFVGVLGAAMALAMPSIGFSGYSLFLPRMLGFYGTHIAVLMEGLALVTFGLYQPKFRDLPKNLLLILLFALAACGFSLLLRATGLNPKANYFFSVETEGNAILEYFHRWLPAPFFYLLPNTFILAAYMYLVMGIITLINKIRKKDAADSPDTPA